VDKHESVNPAQSNITPNNNNGLQQAFLRSSSPLHNGMIDFIHDYGSNVSPINYYSNHILQMSGKNIFHTNMNPETYMYNQSIKSADYKDFKGFPLPGNVNPLNSFAMDTPERIKLNLGKDGRYDVKVEDEFIHSEHNSDNHTQINLPVINKDKLPKMDIELINFSDSSKVLTNRIFNDFINQNGFEGSGKHKYDDNTPTLQCMMSNPNMKLNEFFHEQRNAYIAEYDDQDSGQVIKPHFLKHSNSQIENNISSPKIKNEPILSMTTAKINTILSLNVSPKSAFIIKPNVCKKN